MVRTMSDKDKVLRVVTRNWQPTSTIGKKLNMNWGVAMGMLGMLVGEGLIDVFEVKRMKTMMYLWKLTDIGTLRLKELEKEDNKYKNDS